jgi:hypothetical protein
MLISGHKTRSVFDRYNIVSEEDLRDAAKKNFSESSSTEKRVHRSTYGSGRRGQVTLKCS